MKKRLLSFFLVLAIALYCSVSVFAVDTGVDIIDDPLSFYFQNQLLGTYKGTGVSLYCPECDYKVEYTGGTLVTCPYDGAQLLLAGKYGVKATPVDMKNAGSNVPPGGRNPKGYQNETGVPSVNSTGAITIMVEPYALGATNYGNGFHKSPSDFSVYHLGSSGSGTNYPNGYWCGAIYKFIAPVTGLYYAGSFLPKYDFGYFEYFSNEWSKQLLTINPSKTYEFSSSLTKGVECYFIYSISQKYSAYSGKSYRFKLNSIPIFIDPLDDSGVTNQNTITINNNTWNGNIYVDSSNKLTYIYPQYTTINENNETVTNISNNPIIYNNETKQYYTYDSVTNNYYYITYGDPAPTPTPSPSPDPGGSTPDPDNPSPSPSPSTAPGGSSDKETGGNSFFNFIFGFGNDTGKDENGKKGIIWSLISLLVSCVTFVVGMGTAYSYLFPFLPPGLCTTIHICVLVLFLFAVIKFIRSFI